MDCVKQRHNREVLKERLRSESHFIKFFFFFFPLLTSLIWCIVTMAAAALLLFLVHQSEVNFKG